MKRGIDGCEIVRANEECVLQAKCTIILKSRFEIQTLG